MTRTVSERGLSLMVASRLDGEDGATIRQDRRGVKHPALSAFSGLDE